MRHAEAERPDVVIMDWSMPVLDGIAATRAIRERCPGVTVIAFSSAADTRTREEFRAAGAAHYVDKADLDGLLDASPRWHRVRPPVSRPPNHRQPPTRSP